MEKILYYKKEKKNGPDEGYKKWKNPMPGYIFVHVLKENITRIHTQDKRGYESYLSTISKYKLLMYDFNHHSQYKLYCYIIS